MSGLARLRHGRGAATVAGAAFLFFLAKGIFWLIVFAVGAAAAMI